MHRLAALALTSALIAAPAGAGFSYTMKITNAGGPHADAADSVAHVSVDHGGARIEWVESHNPLFGKTGYMLFKQGKMYVVDPDKKTYAVLDLEAMGNSMSAMMGGGSGFKIAYDDVQVEKLSEEAGPAMLGYPTTHYRFRTHYKQTINMGPMSLPSVVDSTEESWTTTAINLGDAAEWMSSFTGARMGKELQKLIDAKRQTITGIPLKTVMTTKMENQGTGLMAMANRGNNQGPTTTTMEMTELREASLPAALFEIPAGYSETQLMNPNPAMQGNHPH